MHDIVPEHFSSKIIEYLSCKLFPNSVQFRNALETSRSSNYPKSNEICLKFRFCKVFPNI